MTAKRPLCRCKVWAFPHRLSATLCEPDEDFLVSLYLTHRELWSRIVDRLGLEEREQLISQPGRSHFDSNADYNRAKGER